ncbi:MAG: aminopeptidase P family protein [Acidobacteria bacterium]|nr:aminopeptidase P family protein [Acidobacteriota bacterium]
MPSRRSFLLAASAAAVAPSLDLQAQQPSSSFLSSGKLLPPAIAALTNRRSEAVPITLEEREHRIGRARELLAKNRIDALVICAGTSLNYFTGLHWEQSERFFAWVLPAKGNPFVVCPVFEEARLRERMDARPATLPAASATRFYTWYEDDSPYALLAKALKDAGISTGRIGLEERTQFAFTDGIEHAAPTLTTVSGTPVTAGCRAVKSAAELALMRLANDNTLKVYEAAWSSLSPGMTNEHVSQLISAAYDRTGFPGEASCQVGPYSALPHGSLQPQVIKEGEIILLDDGCTVEGYQSDISRSFVLGKASSKQKRIFDIVYKAQSAALAAGKAGAPCHAVDDAARKVIADAGFGPGYKYFTHRLGHGIGMDEHEWPYLVRGNNTTLEPGMTFSDEPGIYIVGEFGIRLEDDWVCTPNGGEMFTPQSPSLEQPFAKA